MMVSEGDGGMSRGLGRTQRMMLEALADLNRDWGPSSWPLHRILSKAKPGRPREAGAAKPHKLRRRPPDCGDRDNPSRAMASLINRGLVQRDGERFSLTAAGAMLVHPKAIWAARLTREGVQWREVEVSSYTLTRATVVLDGVSAVVTQSRLFGCGAPGARSNRHPGYTFTDQRHGLVEAVLQIAWNMHYGRRRNAMPRRRVAMPTAQAAVILGLPSGQIHTQVDIQSAFRTQAKAAHPDAGGTDAAFVAITQARDVLLAASG